MLCFIQGNLTRKCIAQRRSTFFPPDVFTSSPYEIAHDDDTSYDYSYSSNVSASDAERRNIGEFTRKAATQSKVISSRTVTYSLNAEKVQGKPYGRSSGRSHFINNGLSEQLVIVLLIISFISWPCLDNLFS